MFWCVLYSALWAHTGSLTVHGLYIVTESLKLQIRQNKGVNHWDVEFSDAGGPRCSHVDMSLLHISMCPVRMLPRNLTRLLPGDFEVPQEGWEYALFALPWCDCDPCPPAPIPTRPPAWKMRENHSISFQREAALWWTPPLDRAFPSSLSLCLMTDGRVGTNWQTLLANPAGVEEVRMYGDGSSPEWDASSGQIQISGLKWCSLQVHNQTNCVTAALLEVKDVHCSWTTSKWFLTRNLPLLTTLSVSLIAYHSK